jgi:hypothetical protein
MGIFDKMRIGGKRMITFKRLGKKGRLGNQMFQFAFIYNVGKKKGFDIGYDYSNNPLISKIFNLPAKNSDSIRPKNIVIENNNSIYFDISDIQDNTDFQGFFQNSKYVYENELDLKQIYSFDSKKHLQCFNFIKSLKEKVQKELVAVHVRRTDYLIAEYMHFVCDKNYYDRAISNFGDKYFYVFFTDDKNWCFNEFKHIPNIIMNNDTEIDLILMSLCDHNIISNSSYSWWGSWLNENLNKKIIAPKRWYNKIGPKEWENIYRPEMILI